MMKSEDLPEDLVDEILCRVPAKNLKRLRSTCKRWNRLYDDWRFARNQYDKSPKQFLILMLTNDLMIRPMRVNLTQVLDSSIVPSVELKGKLSLFDPKNPAIQFDIAQVFHCDGLLLCTSPDCCRIVVWNPFTGETRWIGYRPNQLCVFALGYSRSNRSLLKILSFCLSGKISSEIYECNSDSWRILDHDIAPGWELVDSDKYVSLKGSTYMFARDETKTKLGLSLLKFDFSTEKCGPVPLPYQRDRYEAMSLSVVREEKLSVLLHHKINSKTEIWVSNKIDEGSTKVVSWSKVLALDLSPSLQIDDYASFLLDEEKKLIVCCTRWLDTIHQRDHKDKIYIVGDDNKVTQVEFEVIDIDEGWPAILYYVPSLVQIDRARGKRKRLD